MNFKNTIKGIKFKLSKFKRLISFNLIVLILCIISTIAVYLFLKSTRFETFDPIVTLTNILTVNGVFSAILITYLFSRITWLKDRKLDVYREAISISRKITDYRRILNKLTEFYGVWENDKATKTLLTHGKYSTVDFYDFSLSLSSNYTPYNYELIQELYRHPDFKEGQSTLYLAMISLLKNRNNPDFEWHGELYKDFELNGIYKITAVEKWLDSDLFETIAYWLNQKNNYINYNALGDGKGYILSAISRINSKYEGHELSDSLLSDISDDFSSHYIKELYLKLKELKNGLADLNLIIIFLITISMFFGVLTPYGLLLVSSETYLYSQIVGIVSSINVGLIAFFILRFPGLINRELKWT